MKHSLSLVREDEWLTLRSYFDFGLEPLITLRAVVIVVVVIVDTVAVPVDVVVVDVAVWEVVDVAVVGTMTVEVEMSTDVDV